MTEYYYLATVLPPLQFGVEPEISFEELSILLQDNLSSVDENQAKVIRRYYDILNIRAFWKEQPLDPHGNLNENELEEALADRAHIPKYLNRFLNEYESKEDRLKNFPKLLAAYFHDEELNARGFLEKYLKLERDMRLILVAFRAKKTGRDLLKELQYENPEEKMIAQIVAQKDDAEFHPPEPYEDLKPIFTQYSDDPIALHQALLEWRYQKIREMVGFKTFSSDQVLGYLTRFILIENWLELDKEKGIEIVDSLLKERT
jgi:hypothetical protein